MIEEPDMPKFTVIMDSYELAKLGRVDLLQRKREKHFRSGIFQTDN